MQNNDENMKQKSTYRKIQIGKATYHVTSVFTGEKELGSILERLAVRRVLDEMNKNTQKLLENC